jgi:hypothetical protein
MDKHRNADGTYDGAGVMSELSGLSREQIEQIAREAKVDMNFTMYPNGSVVGAFTSDEFMRLMNSAYTAGRDHEKAVRLQP